MQQTKPEVLEEVTAHRNMRGEGARLFESLLPGLGGVRNDLGVKRRRYRTMTAIRGRPAWWIGRCLGKRSWEGGPVQE